MNSQPARTVTSSYATRVTPNVTPTEWNSWLTGSPGGGHVLQSYEWGEFKRSWRWRPIRMVLERDSEVVGVGQFLLYNTTPVPGYLMYCTKGPWLPWDDEEAVRTFFDGARALAEREGAHTVKIEPEVLEQRNDVKALLSRIGFRKARYDLNDKTTMVVDLEPSEEELLARMKSKTRYNIRLAARKGVEVTEPDDFEEAWETLYNLSKITAERGGLRVRRSREYLRDVAFKMRAAGRAHLFFAEHEGDRLATMIVFTLGRKYWYMGGASSNEKRNLMPTYLLQWEVMRWARERSMTYYDMVGIPKPENLNPEDSLWGIYRFKVGFGGEISDFLGCLDPPVRPARAAAWYRLEPVYYRLFQKLKHNIFY